MTGEHMKKKTFTMRQIYKEGSAYLAGAGVRDASLDAWLLLESVTGVSRAAYYGNPDAVVAEEDAGRYQEAVKMRAKRVPLQHITGEQVFMGYPFSVNGDVLIPRQDTEVLVEEGLRVVKPGIRVLDMCTGSGCILLSLLKNSREKKRIGGLTGLGTDVSEKALAVARGNARRLGVDAEFLQSDLFTDVEGTFHLIISNPPYIPTADIPDLEEEVRLFDPVLALDGKEDGLYYYRRIIQDSAAHIAFGGYLLFEIGCNQAGEVVDLMKNAGYRNIMVKKDLAGLDRVVLGMYNER